MHYQYVIVYVLKVVISMGNKLVDLFFAREISVLVKLSVLLQVYSEVFQVFSELWISSYF